MINALQSSTRDLRDYERGDRDDLIDPALVFEATISAIELINVEPAIIYVFSSAQPIVNQSTLVYLYSNLQSQNIQVRVVYII